MCGGGGGFTAMRRLRIVRVKVTGQSKLKLTQVATNSLFAPLSSGRGFSVVQRVGSNWVN
ncbi:hypothetical protein CCP3SC1_430005 [Gammaproteobacteria bacterium]